ncbi:MAG: N-acetyltransferase [Dehalococcoidia bacterium]
MSVSATAAITVSPVVTKQDREAFLRLPWRLYKDDPAWVPNLLMLQRELISEHKNPFFDHGKAQLFLARRGETVVGRISANIDRRHNEYHHETTGFFGFFEAENDPEIARSLFAAAEVWLREHGMTASRGPFGFSIDQEVGLLIEGFEHPPMIDMTHAPPYYGPLVESAGYAKVIDLFAYKWEIKDPPERMMEAIRKTQAVPGLSVRRVRMSKLKEEVGILLDIYRESWNQNWGYVDVTERAARKMADDLRLIADPNVVLIAEMDGEPAGMVVGIPNLYEAIRDFKGFIDPIKAIKLLWRLKVRGTETGRLLLFGVKPKFRTRELYGLPFLLLYELYRGAQKKRYKWCEESWVLETNGPLNAMMPYWDAYVYKKYRIYEKAL